MLTSNNLILALNCYNNEVFYCNIVILYLNYKLKDMKTGFNFIRKVY